MIWSSRSRRQLSTQRSARPFCQGFWNEVRTGLIFINRNSGCYLDAILCITIKDEKPGSQLIRKGFPQLLDDPTGSRLPGNIEVQNAAAVMADNKETVEHAKGNCWDGEEVHRSDGFTVVVQECQPSASRFGISRSTSHPAGDGSLKYIETEHEQFAVDARCTPCRILRNHLEDQVTYRLGDSLPSNALSDSGDQAPVHPKAGSVPADHGVRCDDGKRTLPAVPKPACANPEQFVAGSESRSWVPTLQHGQLLTECGDLEEETSTFVEKTKKDPEAQPEEAEHG